VPVDGDALSNAIVVISDLVEQTPGYPVHERAPEPRLGSALSSDLVAVVGGYLERLPLAAVRSGMAEFAEIWHHHRSGPIATRRDSDVLVRRSFPLDSDAPFHSNAMVDFVRRHGAPKILCVLGLGVSEQILKACASSTIIYNSIDVPALRVPGHVSRHFDLVLTGAQWQSDDVLTRHPGMPAAILPIGPDFASPQTFFPIAHAEKRYDVVYVAAAQGYKRHDILFDALARAPRSLRALCVMGYGEDGDRLRDEARHRGLDIDFIGPPGVPHHEVNRLINQARVGVVCGQDDGAPAILTEYMLAGLPVVANANLRCGVQYIRPDTGIAVPPERFEAGIMEALARKDFTPREVVLDQWAWSHSIARLAHLVQAVSPKPPISQTAPEFV